MAKTLNVGELIEQVTVASLETENTQKSRHSVLQENFNIKKKIQDFNKKYEELVQLNKKSFQILCSNKFEWEHLLKKEKFLNGMLEEKKQELDNENATLEKTQSKVWDDRRDFCDQVQTFSRKYRPTFGSNSEKKIDCGGDEVPVINTDDKDKALLAFETEYKALQCELKLAENKYEDKIKELHHQQIMPITDEEFLRLEDAIKFSETQAKQNDLEYQSIHRSLKLSFSEGRPDLQSNNINQNNNLIAHAKDINDRTEPTSSNQSKYFNSRMLAEFSDGSGERQTYIAGRDLYLERKGLSTNQQTVLNSRSTKTFIPRTPSAISKRLMLCKSRISTLGVPSKNMNARRPELAEYNMVLESGPIRESNTMTGTMLKPNTNNSYSTNHVPQEN